MASSISETEPLASKLYFHLWGESKKKTGSRPLRNREPASIRSLRQDGELAVFFLHYRLTTDAIAHADLDGVVTGRQLARID
jgi:hypothetical protein